MPAKKRMDKGSRGHDGEAEKDSAPAESHIDHHANERAECRYKSKDRAETAINDSTFWSIGVNIAYCCKGCAKCCGCSAALCKAKQNKEGAICRAICSDGADNKKKRAGK